MLKKYPLLSAAILANFLLSPCVAEAHKTKGAHSKMHLKPLTKQACSLLTPKEKSKGYDILLPDLTHLANQRADVLEKQMREIKNLNAFGRDFATSWFYALSLAYEDSIGALPSAREDLKKAIDRFKNILTCPDSTLACAEDLTPQEVAGIMTHILPSVLDNFKLRISVLEKFIKAHPHYKEVAARNALTWRHFVTARIEKLKALDRVVEEKVFATTISQLEALLKKFDRVIDCTI